MSSHIFPVIDPRRNDAPLRGFDAAADEIVTFHSLRNVHAPTANAFAGEAASAIPVKKFIPFETNDGMRPFHQLVSSRRFRKLAEDEKRMTVAAFASIAPAATEEARRHYDSQFGADSFNAYWHLNAG